MTVVLCHVQELMAQATWNLCPLDGAPNSSCYYASEQSFTQLSGTSTTVLSDVPDGLVRPSCGKYLQYWQTPGSNPNGHLHAHCGRM